MDPFVTKQPSASAGKKRRSKVELKKSMLPSHQELFMNGIKILLPSGITPYTTQKMMILKVLLALKNETNSLIESPTGSGKTLALLASTGAWLVDYIQKRHEQRKFCPKHGIGLTKEDVEELSVKKENMHASDTTSPDLKRAKLNTSVKDEPNFIESFSQVMSRDSGEASMDSTDVDGAKCNCLPSVRIYYCTRTHKQIAQVVKEYSRLPYAYLGKLRHTVLASRQQTCINDEVRKMGGDLNKHCRDLLKAQKSAIGKGCAYRDELSRKYERRGTLRAEMEGKLSHAWDLEEITEVMKLHTPAMCPYFASTRYLTMDSDVVFCPFNYLLDPIIRNSSDVHLKNSIVILDEAHNIEDVCRDSASFSFSEAELASALHDFKNKLLRIAEHKNFTNQILNNDQSETGRIVEDLENGLVEMNLFLRSFHAIFKSLVQRAKRVGTPSHFQPLSISLDWQQTLEVFGKFALPSVPGEHKKLFSAFQVVAGKGAEAAQTNHAADLSAFLPTTLTVVCVEKILYFVDFYQRDQNKNYYKCNMTIESARNVRGAPGEEQHEGEPAVEYEVPGFHVSLSLWCMLPAVSANDAFSTCRSVILASGTLHPLESFSTELGMDFRFTMQGEQLIAKERIFAAGLPWGPTNKPLKLTYREMESDPGIKLELARIVFDICQIVPKGVLCFLASYRMLDDLMSNLERSGLMKKLQLVKEVFTEPKSTMDMLGVQNSFEHAAQFPRPGRTGALMLAVFRGKVSEGVDFADDRARCVISVGIPFPNLKDEQVAQKRRFNDENAREMGLLSGSEWYSMQAFRALNQALGRCLRHRDDWGALVLVDERLHCPQPKVSKWVRERMARFPAYAQFRQALAAFVALHAGDGQPAKPPPDLAPLAALETPPAMRGGGFGGSTASTNSSSTPARRGRTLGAGKLNMIFK